MNWLINREKAGNDFHNLWIKGAKDMKVSASVMCRFGPFLSFWSEKARLMTWLRNRKTIFNYYSLGVKLISLVPASSLWGFIVNIMAVPAVHFTEKMIDWLITYLIDRGKKTCDYWLFWLINHYLLNRSVGHSACNHWQTIQKPNIISLPPEMT